MIRFEDSKDIRAEGACGREEVDELEIKKKGQDLTTFKKYQTSLIAFCLIISLAVPPSLVLSVGMSFIDTPLAYATGEVPVPAPAGESSGAEQSFDPASVGSEGGSGSSTTTSGGNIDYGPGGYIVDGALSAASGSDSNYSSDGSNYSSDGSNYSSDGSNYSSDGSSYSSEGSNSSYTESGGGSDYGSSSGYAESGSGSDYSNSGSGYTESGSGSDYGSSSSYSDSGSGSDYTNSSSGYTDTGSGSDPSGGSNSDDSVVGSLGNDPSPVLRKVDDQGRLIRLEDPTLGVFEFDWASGTATLKDLKGSVVSKWGGILIDDLIQIDDPAEKSEGALNSSQNDGRFSIIDNVRGYLMEDGADLRSSPGWTPGVVRLLDSYYRLVRVTDPAVGTHEIDWANRTASLTDLSGNVVKTWGDLQGYRSDIVNGKQVLSVTGINKSRVNLADGREVVLPGARGRVISERTAAGDLINYDRSDPANIKISVTSAATGETAYYVNCAFSVSSDTLAFPTAAIASAMYNRGTLSRVVYSNGDNFVLNDPVTRTVTVASGPVNETTFTATVTRNGVPTTYNRVRGVNVSPENGIEIDQISVELFAGGGYQTTKRFVYSPSSHRLISTTTYTYDGTGRLASSREDRATAADALIPYMSIDTRYDAQGRVTQRTYLDRYQSPNTIFRTEDMTYNGRGLLEQTTVKIMSGVMSSTTRGYDASGRLVKETITEPSDPSNLVSPSKATTRYTVYDAVTSNISKIVTFIGSSEVPMLAEPEFPSDYFRAPATNPHFSIEFFDATGKSVGVGQFSQSGPLDRDPTIRIQINKVVLYERTVVPGTNWVQVSEKNYDVSALYTAGQLTSNQIQFSALNLAQFPDLRSAVPVQGAIRILNAKGQLMKEMGVPNLRAAGPTVNVTTFYVYNADGSLKQTLAYEGSVTSLKAPISKTGLLLVENFERGQLKTADRYIGGAKDNTTFYVETQRFDASGNNISLESCNIRFAGQGGRTSDLLTVYHVHSIDGPYGSADPIYARYNIIEMDLAIFDTSNSAASTDPTQQWTATGNSGYLAYAIAGNIYKYANISTEITSVTFNYGGALLDNPLLKPHLIEYLYMEKPETLKLIVKLYEIKPLEGAVNTKYLWSYGPDFSFSTSGSGQSFWVYNPTRADLMTPGTYVYRTVSGYSSIIKDDQGYLVVDSNLFPPPHSAPTGSHSISYVTKGLLPGEFLTRTFWYFDPPFAGVALGSVPVTDLSVQNVRPRAIGSSPDMTSLTQTGTTQFSFQYGALSPGQYVGASLPLGKDTSSPADQKLDAFYSLASGSLKFKVEVGGATSSTIRLRVADNVVIGTNADGSPQYRSIELTFALDAMSPYVELTAAKLQSLVANFNVANISSVSFIVDDQTLPIGSDASPKTVTVTTAGLA